MSPLRHAVPRFCNVLCCTFSLDDVCLAINLLADNVEGSLKICHPDSKLHIYDRSKGAALTFDFAPHRYLTTAQPFVPVYIQQETL
jgi:hypothetical protein